MEIQDQIEVSFNQRVTTGWNVWANGEVRTLKMDNVPGFPSESAMPLAGTVGVDHRWSNGTLVGVALTIGQLKSNFDIGGSYTQNELTGSVYAAARTGPFWGDVIASFGALHYDVNRNALIGITRQANYGSTSGTDFSLSGETGYEFVSGWLRHGPVLGLTLQEVKVGGFTESGSFTSLAFESQHRESMVSAVGYRAFVDLGMFQPFAKVVWNRELARTERSVTTSLTTIAAPSYTMPALEFGKDWASGSVGTTLKLGSGVTGLLAMTGQAAQDNVVTCGGRAGVNVAF
jgi:outer membrane lipase/esterase